MGSPDFVFIFGRIMEKLEIVILDADTLGSDIEYSRFEEFGNVTVYGMTAENTVGERVRNADIIIVNKIRLGAVNLGGAEKLKLICVTATGYDNIDIQYCGTHGIAVCNVRGYSSESVAQVTAAVALSLVNGIGEFDRYVKSGEYTESGIQNRVEPRFREMSKLTWGIVGLGAIGRKTARIAEAFGCRVVAFKRTPDSEYECIGIDELCGMSDIISIHLPLTAETENLISAERIALMKNTAVVINVARGAVVDEAALAEAVANGRIGGLGIDVYSDEPMSKDSPYTRLKNCGKVILTPHMAWGAYEARVRCMEEIAENIRAFYAGKIRNRADIL